LDWLPAFTSTPLASWRSIESDSKAIKYALPEDSDG